ncbi:hypothetical protein [Desulfovibrio sp.]
MTAASDFTFFVRFLVLPEDSAGGGVRRTCGSRCAALVKTAFWLAAAVAAGLCLGRLG